MEHKSEGESLVLAEGVRLLELSCLVDALESLLVCRCGVGSLELKEDVTESDGLYSSLYLVCKACLSKLHLPTSKSTIKSNCDQSEDQSWEVNYCTEHLIRKLNLKKDFLVSILKGYRVPFVNSNTNYNRPKCDIVNKVAEPHERTPETIFDSVEDIQDSPENENIEPENELPVEIKNNTPFQFIVNESKEDGPLVAKSFPCVVCKLIYKSEEELKRHQCQNCSVLHICSQCSKTFDSDFQLRNHKKQHHKNHLECSVCGKIFKRTFNLTQHARTHTGEKPFHCSTCGKSFGDPSTLSKHRKAMHSADRPLQCQTCGKTFYHAGHLRVHVRKHTGEKPFKCAICHKTYAYRDSIKKHMTLHTDDRQFQCSVCNRAFCWRESLKQHMITHQQKGQPTSEEGWQQQVAASAEKDSGIVLHKEESLADVPQSQTSSQAIWQQQVDTDPQSESVTDQLPTATARNLSVPVTVTNTDTVSLTQVITYLETIRVEYT